MSNNKKPVSKITLYWPVTAAIWRNETPDGQVFFNATYECSYKEENGKYQSSDSYGRNNSLLLSKVADLASQQIAKLEATERTAQKADQQTAE